MMPVNLREWVIVFDLDDTLYKEIDYVESGILAVSDALSSICGQNIKEILLDAKAKGCKDLWAYACQFLQLPISTKESLIWIYRLHLPCIKLGSDTHDFLEMLADVGATLAILTDGRSITQRLKINALGLTHIPAFISEDFQSEKPEPLRFMRIMERWPNRRYVYIGDNPQKDFIAPNLLGWATFGLSCNGRNIHSQLPKISATNSAPMYWINQLNEIVDFLC